MAGHVHLDGGQIERFARGDSPPPERRRIVLHLLAGCAACAAAIRPLLAFADEPLRNPRRWRAQR